MPRIAPSTIRPAKRNSGRPPGQRPTRLRLLLRRSRRLGRPFAWILSIAVLIGGGAALLRAAPVERSVLSWRERLGGQLGLTVEKIVVEGRHMTPESLLAAAIGLRVGQPLLGFSLDAVRDRVESLTWVQSASIERRLPGTIVVNLVERRPFAVWQNQGKFVLIDRAGQVVAPQDPVKDTAAFRVLPLVVGPGAPAHAAELLDLLDTHPALRSHVTAAIRVGERRWNLRLVSGADVLLPEGHDAAAMQRLSEIQRKQDLLDRPLQVLDMRLPDRLVLRPQPSPSAADPTEPRRPT